ncbi:hypothetical protein ACV8DN_002934 [Morganella morganii]
MVNQKILSQYTSAPPEEGGDRKIANGPLYTTQQVIDAIKAIPWTRKCKNDTANLCIDNTELLQLLKEAVVRGRYKDSEWCTDRPGGNLVACDSYVYKKASWSDNQSKEVIDEYFIKFCVGKGGILLLTASCHL